MCYWLAEVGNLSEFGPDVLESRLAGENTQKNSGAQEGIGSQASGCRRQHNVDKERTTV